MTISTYDQLKTATASWLARDDLTANIPDFITLAEARINRTVYHPLMEARSNATVLTTSDEPEFISLPTDFQTMRRVYLPGISGEPSLEYRSEAQLTKTRTTIGNIAGQPAQYTIFGTEMELLPTPDAAYELEMVYRGTLTALSTSNASNWLLTLAPDVYLYGTLLESVTFTKDTDSGQVWSAAYSAAIEELARHGRNYKGGSAPIRVTVSGQFMP